MMKYIILLLLTLSALCFVSCKDGSESWKCSNHDPAHVIVNTNNSAAVLMYFEEQYGCTGWYIVKTKKSL